LATLVLLALCSAFLYCVISTPLRLVIYLPAYVYRLSLKSTAIAYFPLLLIIQQSTSNIPVMSQLEQVRDGRWSALRRVMAWVCIAALVAKQLIYSMGVRMADAWNSWHARDLLTVYIAPYELPKWQLATLVNSITVLVFYYFVDVMLRRRKRGEVVPEQALLVLLRFVIVVTGILGLYSVAANIYIIANHQPFIVWPRLGPWWPAIR
jgi:hypothetical protein